jgi:hypothetical protein
MKEKNNNKKVKGQEKGQKSSWRYKAKSTALV